jgi:gas vesicle protein
MRYAFFFLCLVLLLPACNSCGQENNRLKEEIKMLREENEYAKAEIIGLKKELAELSAKVRDEREALQKKLEEERGLMRKKIGEEHEAMQKKDEADKKKGGAVKKDRLQMNAGSGGNKTKEPDAKTVPRKTPGSKTPTGGSPGEE